MLVAKEREEPFSNHMGWSAQIANPIAGRPEKLRAASSGRLCEQGVGSGAVRANLVAVGDHPGNFRLKQGDSLGQFILRIGRKILAGEATRRVS
jgi:hypothetical protein